MKEKKLKKLNVLMEAIRDGEAGLETTEEEVLGVCLRHLDKDLGKMIRLIEIINQLESAKFAKSDESDKGKEKLVEPAFLTACNRQAFLLSERKSCTLEIEEKRKESMRRALDEYVSGRKKKD